MRVYFTAPHIAGKGHAGSKVLPLLISAAARAVIESISELPNWNGGRFELAL
jgi:hypothetical protein